MLSPFGSRFRRYFFSSIPSCYASLTMMTYGTQRNLERYEIIPYCFLLFPLFPTFPYCPLSFPTILLLSLPFPAAPYCSVLSLSFPTIPYCSYSSLLLPIIPHCFLSPLFPTIPIVSYCPSTVSYCPSTASYCPLQFFSLLFPYSLYFFVIQTIPFWPNKTPAKNLKIKTDESPVESVPFNFESNVNLLLRMDNGVSEKK